MSDARLQEGVLRVPELKIFRQDDAIPPGGGVLRCPSKRPEAFFSPSLSASPFGEDQDENPTGNFYWDFFSRGLPPAETFQAGKMGEGFGKLGLQSPHPGGGGRGLFGSASIPRVKRKPTDSEGLRPFPGCNGPFRPVLPDPGALTPLTLSPY